MLATKTFGLLLTYPLSGAPTNFYSQFCLHYGLLIVANVKNIFDFNSVILSTPSNIFAFQSIPNLEMK